MGAVLHPHKNDSGGDVVIKKPSQPTALASWTNTSEIATVIPQGTVPAELNGIALQPWLEVPTSDNMWEKVKGQHGGLFDEPIFKPTPGKRMAAGVVVEEDDGRIWVVHPSNAFGGYQATFPKGTVAHGGSLQATAIKEAFEESGLQVEITAYLADSERSQSKTRYYFGRRVGGSPAEMGWESQAVSLVPLAKLAEVLTHRNDVPLVKALQQERRPALRHIIKYQYGLSSGWRIVATINGYHRKYGAWPVRLFLDAGMAGAIRNEVLTPLGWAIMASKLDIVPVENGGTIAEGPNGARCDYNVDPGEQIPSTGPHAEEWIWGIRLSH